MTVWRFTALERCLACEAVVSRGYSRERPHHLVALYSVPGGADRIGLANEAMLHGCRPLASIRGSVFNSCAFAVKISSANR